jgi:micrococcal nuclease
VVTRVIDGDTVELADGERVRYLLVDATEVDAGDCWSTEATEFNRDLVEGQEVELGYDVECTDPYGRLLAWVGVDERQVNALLVERGHACVLSIPPNGEGEVDAFLELQAQAQAQDRGMWGACPIVACADADPAAAPSR